MHIYGQWPDELFNQVSEAAYEIGTFISRWGRIGVMQTKEKYGTVRVYCSFGFDCIHGLIWPRHCWIHRGWPLKLDLWISKFLKPVINPLFCLLQKKIYRLAYKRAVKKYPHLRDEIFSCADWGEALEGVEDYRHSDYWQEVK
jgi:hypothetical protein